MLLKNIVTKLNATTKMASLAAILLVIPFAIQKPQSYQTSLKLNTESADVLVAPSQTVNLITVPSRLDQTNATRALDPQAIKALMQEIAPEYGVDWKLVYAIGAYESGNYNSSLARRNYNFFGRKASSRTWMKYATPEDAIHNQFAYLKTKYFDRGLNTPAKIGPVYCEGNTWASKVTSIMRTL